MEREAEMRYLLIYEYKPDFELRMFEYLSRIYLREKLPVYSVAI